MAGLCNDTFSNISEGFLNDDFNSVNTLKPNQHSSKVLACCRNSSFSNSVCVSLVGKCLLSLITAYSFPPKICICINVVLQMHTASAVPILKEVSKGTVNCNIHKNREWKHNIYISVSFA